jgi:choline-sulfatase
MTRPPNILMIQVDQQSASALSAYGGKVARTPHIDRLAMESALFQNAYTNYPLCVPSRCSMMTGQLATAVGAYDTGAEFPASVPTIAHYLRNLGYQTTLCGKMHFIGPDQLHGFEERLTSEIYPADFGMLTRWDVEEASDYTTNVFDTLKTARAALQTVQIDYDEEVQFRAERRLHDYVHSPDRRPFFLLVSYTHPHEPFICPPDVWNRYQPAEIDMPRLGKLAPDRADPHTLRLYRHYGIEGAPIGEALIRSARHGYYGCMSYIDDKIGRLLNLLRELDLDEDTVVLFTSDHGEMLGERGLWFKKCFFENAVRIPLMIRIPRRGHRRIEANVSLVDLLPTLVDLAAAGAQVPDIGPLEGRSLLPLIDEEGAIWSGTVYGELTCEGVTEPVVMIKSGALKYILSETAGPMLYDLRTDPDEVINQSGGPAYRESEAELFGLAERKWGSLGLLRDSIIASQRQRAFVRDALNRGRYHPWDHLATIDGDRYLRFGQSYNEWVYRGIALERGDADGQPGNGSAANRGVGGPGQRDGSVNFASDNVTGAAPES